MNTHNTKLSHSQNFLRDPKLVEKLVQNSSLENDVVIEIGPGKGIITSVLAKHCKRVLAVEADRNLYAELKGKFASFSNVEIYQQDFLEFSLPKYEYKVFSNIPFNITADIVRKLFDSENSPTDSYLIMQKEASEKYGGFKSETLFSILHKPWFAFNKVYEFQKNDFYPRPAVDTVLLRIEKLERPLVENRNAEAFRDFVAFGFSSMKVNLKKGYTNVFGHVQFLRLATDHGFNASAKPTDLTFKQWLGIFDYFSKNVESFRQAKTRGAYAKLVIQQKSLQKIHRTRTARNWRGSK
jgi:23S rRNA (adenine-N6)-dimethyltransferase